MTRSHSFWIFIVLTALLLAGCAKKIVPTSLPVTKVDQETAKYPPTPEDLILPRNDLALLVARRGSGVTGKRWRLIQNTLHNSFVQASNFFIIPESKVADMLSSPSYFNFDPNNIADVIELGNDLNAVFIAQETVTITESKLVNNVDTFKAKVDITVFTTAGRQVVMKQEVTINSADITDSTASIKRLVETYFPYRGYILETRGGRQVAKISLGRSLDIQVGREFEIRKRIVKQEALQGGMVSETVSFSDVIGTAEVIVVKENESWLEIKEAHRALIRKGHMVFSKPE